MRPDVSTSDESDLIPGSPTVGEAAQYEFKSVQAIRGTGAKTIAKWQKAGWELDTQRQGTFRTEMTFRRVKPKDPWQQLAAFFAKSWAAFRRLKPKTQQLLLAVSGGLVLLTVIVVGVATGSPTATDAASSESQEQKPDLAIDEEAAIAAAEKALAADEEVVVPEGAGAPGQLPDAAAEQAVMEAAPTTALAALAAVEVKGRAPRTGYDRDLFGSAWSDVDRNGCDTRNDMLQRDLTG